ncbi:unnamed protein product [Nippostrongylus brasiliensis]|uniref:Histidine-rich glycoprotein-like n=1 Tax=Nippostrongylus brasiliensis TaxID=27835 RepID=A0A0N4Y7R6_NIPBR|nr:hypothetical protein Q1695_005573 [Nippostrongylus brasiliensis]VDL75809.1 unnamed protein product [Nippostrongylus brasiliensis]
MNCFIISILATLTYFALAEDYYGKYDHGKEQSKSSRDKYDDEQDSTYYKRYTAGFKKAGYGDYITKKYGGYDEYETHHEEGAQYGSEYGTDHSQKKHGQDHHDHGYRKDYYSKYYYEPQHHQHYHGYQPNYYSSYEPHYDHHEHYHPHYDDHHHHHDHYHPHHEHHY